MRPVGLAALVLSAAALCAEPVEYRIAPAQGTRFALRVFKTRFMAGKSHLFLFERYRGTLLYDAQAPENSSVRLVVEAASAVCQDTWVSAKDLRNIGQYALKDMLAAERHPEIVFTSSIIRRAEVQGQLEIRGVPKPVTVTAAVRDSSGELRIDGHAVVKLSDYGIKPRSAPLGVIGTKDEMTVEFTLRATPQR